jgi:hypothetical protein
VLTDSASEQVRKSHAAAIKELQTEARKLLAAAEQLPAYAMVALSANQTARLSSGNHVEFDQIARRGTAIALATGTGQANGLITIAAGKTYLIEVWVGSTNSGIANYQLVDHSDDATLEDETGVNAATFRMVGPSAATAIAGVHSSAVLVAPPASSLTFKFERTAGGTDATQISAGSRIWIQEIP